MIQWLIQTKSMPIYQKALLVLVYIALGYAIYKAMRFMLLNAYTSEKVMFITFIFFLIIGMTLIWISGGISKTIVEYVEQKYKKVALEDMNYVWNTYKNYELPLSYVLAAVKNGKLTSLNDDKLNRSINLVGSCVLGFFAVQLIVWPALFSATSVYKPNIPPLVESEQPFYCTGKGAVALYEIKFYSNKSQASINRVGSVPSRNGFSILKNDGDYFYIKTGFGFRGWFYYKARNLENKLRILENCDIPANTPNNSLVPTPGTTRHVS